MFNVEGNRNSLRNIALLLAFMVSLLSMPAAHADIERDIAKGLPFQLVVRAALIKGIPIEQIIARAMRVAPKQRRSITTAALLLAPNQTQRIVRAAVLSGMPVESVVDVALTVAPRYTKVVLATAMRVAPEKTASIVRTAVAAGVPAATLAPIVQAEAPGLNRDSNLGLVNNVLQDEEVKSIQAEAIPTPPPSLVIPPSRGGDVEVASPN
jgi:hypothetical protein